MTKSILSAAEGTGAKLVMAASCYPYGKVDRPFIVDHSKYENAFGANPTTSQKAIQQTVAWFRDNLA